MGLDQLLLIHTDEPFSADIRQASHDYMPLMSNMLEIVDKIHAQVILETGTNYGDSARIWLTGLERTGGHLWTVDIQDYGDAWADGIPNIHFIKGSSTEIAWDKEVDILYLDSDHTYGHVLKELCRFGPFVKAGGFILMNDTMHHQYGWEVTAALRHYMLAAGMCHWQENVRGFGMAFCQVVEKLPVVQPR